MYSEDPLNPINKPWAVPPTSSSITVSKVGDFSEGVNYIIISVESSHAVGYERPCGSSGFEISLYKSLYGEVKGGHQAVELGLGEGDTEYRGMIEFERRISKQTCLVCL